MSRTVLYLMLSILALACCAVLAGCAAKEAPVADAPPPAPAMEVADDDLSYRNEPLLADSATPGGAITAGDPGDNVPPTRSFENAPPVIPHNTDGYFPITADDNMCLECHAPENAEDAEATSVPASHLYDIRRDTQLTTVNPANFACNLCHAPQTDVDGLVDNTFEPHYRSEESKKSSSLLDILDEGVE
ncbi:MAG: nitrate reductase cytochrome c-type subunit; periplasmic nitrate reductase electron transfer subunit [bacterium]|nr:nitrate reductase cytochrome c-type subunit; periplasmic nitrate reductase electron transfer subunit [bacterium]